MDQFLVSMLMNNAQITVDGDEPIRGLCYPTNEILRLKKLYELSMKLSGDPMDVFVHIAQMIGEILDVKVVCLSEIQGELLYFMSVYINGNIMTNAGSCLIDTTPCATVKNSKDMRIYDRVIERFPHAKFLQDHNAYSYCGLPSFNSEGNVIAVTCLLDDRPRNYSLEDQELLHILGQRIAALSTTYGSII